MNHNYKVGDLVEITNKTTHVFKARNTPYKKGDIARIVKVSELLVTLEYDPPGPYTPSLISIHQIKPAAHTLIKRKLNSDLENLLNEQEESRETTNGS